MIQTLYALAAVMTAMVFIFNQQQHIVNAEFALIRNEVLSQATAVAVDRLEEVGALAFDEQTIGEVQLTSPSQLTASTDFAYNNTPIDDIDDFVNANDAPVTQYRMAWEDSLAFQVITQVAYADEADPGVEVQDPSLRTRYKKVTVRVYGELMSDTIRISQTFACGTKCAW